MSNKGLSKADDDDDDDDDLLLEVRHLYFGRISYYNCQVPLSGRATIQKSLLSDPKTD